MAKYPQFIDNTRRSLSKVLNDISISYDTLSIATGYWDLAGTLEIIENIHNYSSVRLLIGKEPLAHRYQEKFKIDMNHPDNIFPDADIIHDLENYSKSEELNALRDTLHKMVQMIEDERLKVKIFRSPRLHAKAYIFGALREGNSIGIIGSSNFTKAGLTANSELNFLTDDYKIVEFEPQSEKQENGHLTWFNDLWNSEQAEEWTGDFSSLLKDSPLGDYTFGPYDVYIRTLMELFPEELLELDPFSDEIENILHPFQNQNALSLRRKLQTMNVAMLSDSVGLGKTITAAAIIKNYLEEGMRNIVILPPASLRRQWKDELQGERWNLVEGRDFRILSQQDSASIEELIEYSKKQKNEKNLIELFVIDEAHNLRNQGSIRHQQILELFQENPNAKVLMLTATPINNSLMDFANQIQLGSKGDLVSRNVPYRSKKGGKLEYIDFFEALKRIQSEASRAEKRGEIFDWEHNKNTLVTGIRHYLVRSTRQGVIQRNALKPLEDVSHLFPSAKVEQFTYHYHMCDNDFVNEQLSINKESVFEGLKVEQLNLDFAGEITQRTSHPLDLYRQIYDKQLSGAQGTIVEDWIVDPALADQRIFNESSEKLSVIPALFKIINFLGFTPYKPDTYAHNIYGKTIPEIRALNITGKEANKVRIQLSIHNMLHVTWLKRLESSMASLLKSVDNYIDRIDLFEKWLNHGYLVSLSDASLLTKEYDEDIEKAFDDYNQYMDELDNAIQSGTLKEVKKRGVERKIASDEVYNLGQLRKDLERDKIICRLLRSLLQLLTSENHDVKLHTFAENLVKKITTGEFGAKVLVFSFFSDTIKYLKENLPPIMDKLLPGFSQQAEFVTGESSSVEDIAKRFSPNSKNYKMKKDQQELNFLFATDVLSEGQNLQDAGILVNYDLHWNPVRMIQRNGRINRLGSSFDKILIANARPHDDLELYLKLIRRLENKIATINHTVGNDQSVLGETANPIEFNDFVFKGSLYDLDSEKATKALVTFENKGDILDWTDSYSMELRAFIDSHQEDGYVERLKKIPTGKWNYLPKKDKELFTLDLKEVIGLFRTQGQYATTGVKIHDVGFVKINKVTASRGPFSLVRAEHIQEQEALNMIKASPDDNNREHDTIDLDRKSYIEIGATEIGVQFESDRTVYDIRPAARRALEYMTEYFDDNLLGIIQNGIRRSNEKREFERIVLDINRQIRDHGSPFNTTVKRFENLINRLLATVLLEKQLDKVEGVLFYAQNEKIR